jgi:N-methylhydantoinase A
VPLDTSDASTLVAKAYEAFCLLHDQVYGHSTRSPARFVNLRVVQRAATARETSVSHATLKKSPRKGERRILLEGAADFVAAAVYERDGLAPGDAVQGPAIIEQSDTTTLVEPGWRAEAAPNGVLLMRKAA